MRPGHTIFFAFILLLPMQLLVGQEIAIPRLTHYVTDLSGTLSPAEVGALNAKLDEFDKETSTQIVVLMVPTLGSSSIEEASLKVAETNGIGRKGKDNGILLFIAKNERRLRIEVGYGLEGALPDALSGQIIRREIGPHFREGDYAGGIEAGVEAIMLATKNEYKADKRDTSRPGGFSPLLLGFVVAFFLLKLFFRGRRRYRGGGLGPMIFTGLGGGSFSGGGGSSWSGGGFSGGGGSFGGGGASGGW